MVPAAAPPFDDESGAAGRIAAWRPAQTARKRAPAGAGGALARAADTASPGDAGGGADQDGRAEAGGKADAGAGSRAGSADHWPGQFAQILAETLAGSRPPRQITPWTTVQARQRIRQLGPTLTAGRQPRLRRVIASRPAADVVEMTIVVRFGPQLRVLAVRLERAAPPAPGRGPQAAAPRWLCTAVEAA